jgi:glycosyltransferase involved in cell wall biosynthesis
MPVKRTAPLSFREFIKSVYFALAPKGGKLYSSTHTIIRRMLNSRYRYWIKHYDQYSQEDHQRILRVIAGLPSKPLISVIMPVYNPNLEFLNQAIQSVRTQVYPHWELCIADDASTQPGVQDAIQQHCDADHRIKAIFRTTNGHISAASNSALSLATGSHIALLDHDDKLHPLALYHVAKEINAHPNSAIIYSDEDKLTPKGKRIDPYFKSDFDHELFLSQNMVSHLGVFQRELVSKIGGFRLGVEGSQDYDLVLKILPEIDLTQIRHIPRVLYHWRISPHSVADSIEIKPYALEAGKQALADYLAVKNITGEVHTYENFGYKINYALPHPAPTVEIIFINQNSAETCVSACKALIEQAQVNEARASVTFLTHEHNRKFFEDFFHNGLPNAEISIIDLDGDPANLLNEHIKASPADFIALLDDTCSQAAPGWVNRLVSMAAQPGIGCVSPKLVDEKGYIHACGLILSVDAYIQHLFKGVSDAHPNHYFGWSSLHKGFSALPSACLVFKKAHFASLGGFDHAFSDHPARCIDLCLKMRDNRLRNLVLPETIMTVNTTVNDKDQQNTPQLVIDGSDRRILYHRYLSWFEYDPAFNPNLTLVKGKPAVSKAPRKVD